MWEGIPLTPFLLTEIPFGPYKLGLDLFGDGLVYLVYTPGHSRGLISILAKVELGWQLLASDVGYAEMSWKQSILPGFLVDREEAIKSSQWVKEFAQRDDCVAVLCNMTLQLIPRLSSIIGLG